MKPNEAAAKILRENAGARVCRHVNTTGTLVTIYDGRAAGFDLEGYRWRTVCEDHGKFVSHSTYALARSWISRPDEWCEGCQTMLMLKEIPTTIVVDDKVFEKILDLIENPPPPTPAMLALFQKQP